MEDQSLFTTCIQKHIAHQTTKIQKKKEKGNKKEKRGKKEKEKILYWRLTCSLYRINLLEIDLFSSSGYVWMDMTNSA